MLNDLLLALKRPAAVRRVFDRMPPGFKSRVRRSLARVSRGPSPELQTARAANLACRLLSLGLYEQAQASTRFQEPKRLLKHGFSVFSQHDEDGILEEIFRRVGTTDRFFVEFGASNGMENCSTYMLLKGWRGVWIDGSATAVETIQRNFGFAITDGRLRVRCAFLTAEGIEQTFDEMGVPEEFDFLSVDIDGNDYWVWQAIARFRPRVVAVEYNATWRDTAVCVVPYEPTRTWNHTSYYGASLKALEELGRAKGYCLVGCNYTGVNAFFVRADLVEDHFAEPFTSENHYEPARYWIQMPSGHPPGVGPTVSPAATPAAVRVRAPAEPMRNGDSRDLAGVG